MKAGVLMAVAGLLAAASSGNAMANLVVNGGFETETPAGCQTGANGLCNTPPPDWVSNTGVAIDTQFPNTGLYDVAIGDDANGAPGLLSQTLSTTPGLIYTIMFSVFDESANPADSFTLNFGNFTTTITGDAVPSYTQETFTTALTDVTGTATDLEFLAINGLSDFNVDDVSVNAVSTAIPEAPSATLLLAALGAWLGLAKCARRRRMTPGSSVG